MNAGAPDRDRSEAARATEARPLAPGGEDPASTPAVPLAPGEAADAAPPVPGADALEPEAEETPAPESPAGGEEGAPELRDRWLRAEAELQNMRRRGAREREDAWRAAEEGVLLELIAVLDDLERALDASRDAGAPEAWTEGVRLTAGRIRERLARYGVVALDPLGERFDPRFHEALLEIDAPQGMSPGAVAQVVQRGYARGNRALRAARVVVARSPGGSEA